MKRTEEGARDSLGLDDELAGNKLISPRGCKKLPLALALHFKPYPSQVMLYKTLKMAQRHPNLIASGALLANTLKNL